MRIRGALLALLALLAAGCFTNRNPANVELLCGGEHGLDCPGSLICGCDGRCHDHVVECDAGIACVPARFIALAAGGRHNCAIRDDATVWCWGANESAQCGSTNGGNPLRPIQVLLPDAGAPLEGISAIAGAATSSCALEGASGAVWCWGSDGTSDGGVLPQRVIPAGAVQISAGGGTTGLAHACAVFGDGGTVECWGTNGSQQLGSDVDGGSAVPIPVISDRDAGTALSNIRRVAAGGQHTCALEATQGMVLCWGLNGQGQLGDGTTQSRSAPRPVRVADGGVLQGAEAIAAGTNHSCAVLSSGGELLCWGLNTSSQLGNGTMMNRTRPVPPQGGLTGVVAVAGWTSQTCAIRADGTLWCWGIPVDATQTSGAMPIQVFSNPDAGTALAPVLDVDVGFNHVCALVEGESGVWCWGSNGDGQFGIGSFGEIARDPVRAASTCP